MKARFYNNHEFLPTVKEDLLWIWENSNDRKMFERDLKVE